MGPLPSDKWENSIYYARSSWWEKERERAKAIARAPWMNPICTVTSYGTIVIWNACTAKHESRRFCVHFTYFSFPPYMCITDTVFFFLLLYILLSFVLLFNKHVDISKCLLDMMSKISNPNRSIHAKQYFVKLLHFYLNRPTTTKKNERTNERNKCVVFCADESGCHPSNSFCP